MTAPPTKRLSPIWSIVLLLGGIGISVFLILTAPKTEPEDKPRAAKIVQVIDVESRVAQISVTAYGTVIPARQIEIQAEVGGRVISHHPALVPGGRIPDDAPIVKVDPADYDLAIAEREAELEEAEFALSVEQGRQVVAQREWGLLEKDLDDSDVNRSLVLREPHLARASAAIDKANNAIAKAKLDLSRATLKAPFNSITISEAIEVGQLIEAGKTIATLAGTDVFWIQVSVPIEDLRWIRFPTADEPSSGAPASISLDTGEAGRVFSWEGRVVRLLGDLESLGRMARVLVAVSDPLEGSGDANGLPLLLGSYARVDIAAGELEDVIAIPRTALRDGDHLWAVDASNKLQIYDTELRWTDGETLLVNNTLPAGEKLIVSGLRVALPGMEVDPQAAPDSKSVKE